MVHLIYDEINFDSILGKEIFKDYFIKNNIEYMEISYDKIDILFDENLSLINTVYIFGYNKSDKLFRLLSLIKNTNINIFEYREYKVSQISECNRFYINYKNWIIYNNSESLSLQAYNYLYNPHKLLNLNNNVINDISNYILHNYSIENIDLVIKYKILMDKYNNSKDFINLIINSINEEIELYTIDEYNNSKNELLNNKIIGYLKNNIFVIDYCENINIEYIIYDNIKEYLNNLKGIIFIKKIRNNENLVTFFYKEQNENFEELNIESLENKKYYAGYNKVKNKWIKLYYKDNVLYEYIISVSNNYKYKKINLEDIIIYNTNVLNVIKYNQFNSKYYFTKIFNNSFGNKNIASTIISDEILYKFLVNPKF